MAVEFHGQATAEQIALAARLHQHDAAYLATLRTIAKGWVEGARLIVGLATAIGLVGGPLGAERLSGTTRSVAGVLLVLSAATATGGLLAAMSAAHGSLKSTPRPSSLIALAAARRKAGDTARDQIRLGRGLVVTGVVLLGAAVLIGWTDPWPGPPEERLVLVTTDRDHHCGPLQRAEAGSIAVGGDTVHVIGFPDIIKMEPVLTCP
ncbi:hypothetical protein [Euzebya tangerina]|uniref:hypothetical protein n=1 Tax=Euzebya tangerina TaxID=591198 RepID=UPI0013C36170|nr:hypothetical protein [Euzebya tangerina]